MSILTKNIYKSLLLILCTASLSYAQVSPREYQIKAAFIFNFTQFVEWPAPCFPTPQSPAVIGILGTDPFGKYLEEAISGEFIDQHPLIIKHFATLDDVANCHILFINLDDKKDLPATLEKIKGKNILTISEMNRFAKLGGMIRLYTKDDKVNIEINLGEAKAESLTISSKLLKLSEIVKTEKK